MGVGVRELNGEGVGGRSFTVLGEAASHGPIPNVDSRKCGIAGRSVAAEIKLKSKPRILSRLF